MREKFPLEELEKLAQEDVGGALHRARKFYRKTLEDIEIALCIRASQIDAIERGDMGTLPGRVYAIGFVRTYADYLGMDTGKVVQLFKEQYMDAHAKAPLSFPVPALEMKTPSFLLVVFCLLGFIAFVFVIGHVRQQDRSLVETVSDVPEHIKSHVSQDIMRSVLEDIQVGPEENVENMSAIEGQASGIVLNILGDSWVEIRNMDGAVVVSDILNKGEQYFVPNSPELSMSLGNAAYVEIIVNGRLLKPLGSEGEVRRGIPLNIDYLNSLEFVEQAQ